VPLTYSEGGPIQKGMDLNAMHGSGANDIWAVGYEGFGEPGTHIVIDSSLVIHYNGIQWSTCNIPTRGKSLYCVWALSPRSVWTAGVEGIILHWNGANWAKFEVGKNYFMGSIAALSENEAYAYGHMDDVAWPLDSAGSYLFRYDGTKWKVIDSVMRADGEASWHMGTAVSVSMGRLYSTSPNIFIYEEGLWKKLLNAQVGWIWQSAQNNIVASGATAWHYNGEDWKEFIELRPLIAGSCYTDGNEIFIVGNDNYKTIIRHGK
jgi:hypothetical protein